MKSTANFHVHNSSLLPPAPLPSHPIRTEDLMPFLSPAAFCVAHL